MSSGSGGAPGLVEQVLAGSSRDLQAFAAEGVLPIDPTELVALQVVLTGSEDPEIAVAAQQSLDDTDPRLLALPSRKSQCPTPGSAINSLGLHSTTLLCRVGDGTTKRIQFRLESTVSTAATAAGALRG